jgi:ribulose-5-phosphate 4-epimerase/fuculose-1-phosphate aldolase
MNAKMSKAETEIQKLVHANRILAEHGVLDAYGHVSIRHESRPDCFLMACSRSPEFVTESDILEFDLNCNPVNPETRPLYGERPIHGSIYAARPDVQAVIHNHAPEILPYSVNRSMRLRPLIHSAACMGTTIPVWDIRLKFGDTNMLVLNLEQGRDLANCLGSNAMVLMRGHGSTIVGRRIEDAVMVAIYACLNARIQMAASQSGPPPQFLTEGEIELTREVFYSEISINRAWDYWVRKSNIR